MDDGNAGPFRKSSRSLAGVKRTYIEPGSDTDETLLLQLLGDDSLYDPNYENEGNKGSKIKISCKWVIIRNLRKCHGHLGARLKKICLFFFEIT